jgi:hypothetical protein
VVVVVVVGEEVRRRRRPRARRILVGGHGKSVHVHKPSFGGGAVVARASSGSVELRRQGRVSGKRLVEPGLRFGQLALEFLDAGSLAGPAPALVVADPRRIVGGVDGPSMHRGERRGGVVVCVDVSFRDNAGRCLARQEF